MEKFDVILPAGGRLDDHFARVALTPFKALINVQDSSLGFRAIDTVIESGRCGRIVMVAGQEVQDALGGRVTSVIKDTGDLTKNIRMGIQELKSMGNLSSRILILTTDLAYIDAKVLNAYLDLAPDGDLVAPLISRQEFVERFPSATATFAKLKDGDWTIGCAYLIKPDAFMKALPMVEQVVNNRKSVFKLAKILGFGFLWKVVTKSITVDEVVSKINSVLGCRVVPVRSAPAELAFDVDDISDYEYALRNK